jgi:hypothetical protein
MAMFCDVSITVKDNKVTVKPDPAHLYYDDPAGPDCLRWKIGPFPKGATRVEIKWETESPLRNMGAEDGNASEKVGAVIVATGNEHIGGMFKYTVLFMDKDDNIIAGKDPMIINDDHP